MWQDAARHGFLVRGITQFDEPGVFVAFEESAHDLVANVASLGFDLAQYEADGKLVIDHVSVVRGELEETGGASGHQPHLQRTCAIPRAPAADRANGLKCDSSSTRFRSGSGSSRSAPSIRHGSDARERPCTIPSRVSGDS